MPVGTGICLPGQQADRAAHVFLGSCNRNNGNNESYVNSTGNCGNNNAYNANRVVPDRVYILDRRPTHSDGDSDIWHRESAACGSRHDGMPGKRGGDGCC